MLNELRFGWPYRNEQHVADPLTGTGPQITISGIANFGGSIAVGDRFQEKVPNLNDNFTVIKGAHTIKAGFGFQQNLDVQPADIYTQYTFPTIAAYQSPRQSGANPARLYHLQRQRRPARRVRITRSSGISSRRIAGR